MNKAPKNIFTTQEFLNNLQDSYEDPVDHVVLGKLNSRVWYSYTETKYLTAAEARIAELQEGWQPMETAPTDGTPFQAWTDCQEWVPRAAWAVSDGDKKKRFCVWEQVDYDGIEGWAGGYTLIAWMPHPTAPKKEMK
jgi:hypothetical protein